MGTSGVELAWTASSDNNWISYYQVYRDGEPIDRVSKGLYDFDHSELASHGAIYQVQAVDGDGNVSAKVTAAPAGTGAEVYTALGGYMAGSDYSYQGANGWSYRRRGRQQTNACYLERRFGPDGLVRGCARRIPTIDWRLVDASRQPRRCNWRILASGCGASVHYSKCAQGSLSHLRQWSSGEDIAGRPANLAYCWMGDDCSRRHQGQGHGKRPSGRRKTLFHRQR